MVSGGEGFPVLNNKEMEISTTACTLNHQCMTNPSGTQVVTAHYERITSFLYLKCKIGPSSIV